MNLDTVRAQLSLTAPSPLGKLNTTSSSQSQSLLFNNTYAMLPENHENPRGASFVTGRGPGDEIKSSHEVPMQVTADMLKAWESTIRLHGGDVIPMDVARDCPLEQEPWVSVTHVVFTASLVQDTDFYQKALMSKKRVVTHYWLIDVIKKGIIDVPWEINHIPCSFMGKITYSDLAKQRIGITGFLPVEVKGISALVAQIGATLTGNFSTKNTFLLCKRAEGDKFEFAQKHGIPCVNMRWLQDLYLGHACLVNQFNRSLDNKYKMLEGADPVAGNVLALDRTTEKARRFLTPWLDPIRVNERAWMVFRKSLDERDRENVKRKRILLDSNVAYTTETGAAAADAASMDGASPPKREFFPFEPLSKEECEVAKTSRLRHAEPWIVHQVSVEAATAVTTTNNNSNAAPPPTPLQPSMNAMDMPLYQRPGSHVSTADESSQHSTGTVFQPNPSSDPPRMMSNAFHESAAMMDNGEHSSYHHAAHTTPMMMMTTTMEDVWTTDKPPFTHPIIAMSGGLNQLQRSYLKDMILELGGAEAPPDDDYCHKCTHLVALHLRRTSKFYHAILQGRHIVSPKWIQASYLRGAWIDEERWTLKDAVMEELYGVCLGESLRRSRERIRLRQGGLFTGLEFWLSTEALHRDKCMELIRAAGGQIRDRRPTQKLALMPQPKQFIICNESEVTVAQYLTRTKTGNRAVHHEEFVLSGILRQEIDYDSYQIQHVSAFNQQLSAILEGNANKSSMLKEAGAGGGGGGVELANNLPEKVHHPVVDVKMEESQSSHHNNNSSSLIMMGMGMSMDSVTDGLEDVGMLSPMPMLPSSGVAAAVAVPASPLNPTPSFGALPSSGYTTSTPYKTSPPQSQLQLPGRSSNFGILPAAAIANAMPNYVVNENREFAGIGMYSTTAAAAAAAAPPVASVLPLPPTSDAPTNAATLQMQTIKMEPDYFTFDELPPPPAPPTPLTEPQLAKNESKPLLEQDYSNYELMETHVINEEAGTQSPCESTAMESTYRPAEYLHLTHMSQMQSLTASSPTSNPPMASLLHDEDDVALEDEDEEVDDDDEEEAEVDEDQEEEMQLPSPVVRHEAPVAALPPPPAPSLVASSASPILTAPSPSAPTTHCDDADVVMNDLLPSKESHEFSQDLFYTDEEEDPSSRNSLLLESSDVMEVAAAVPVANELSFQPEAATTQKEEAEADVHQVEAAAAEEEQLPSAMEVTTETMEVERLPPS